MTTRLPSLVSFIRNRVACIHCKQRHKPPVGTFCTRIKPVRRKDNNNGQQENSNIINVGVVDASSQPPHPVHSNTSHTQVTVDTPAQKSTKRKHPTNSEVMKKLDTVLEQFSAMEKHLQQEERRDGAFSALSAPSAHSSPKRSAHESSTSRRASHGHTNPPSIHFLRNEVEPVIDYSQSFIQSDIIIQDQLSSSKDTLLGARSSLCIYKGATSGEQALGDKQSKANWVDNGLHSQWGFTFYKEIKWNSNVHCQEKESNDMKAWVTEAYKLANKFDVANHRGARV